MWGLLIMVSSLVVDLVGAGLMLRAYKRGSKKLFRIGVTLVLLALSVVLVYLAYTRIHPEALV